MEAPLEDRWWDLAQRLWLSDHPAHKIKPESIKTDIWDALEADRFSPRALATLENLQIVERYGHTRWPDSLEERLTGARFLWPTFSSDASNQHVLLISIFVGIKQGSHLPIWGTSSVLPNGLTTLC